MRGMKVAILQKKYTLVTCVSALCIFSAVIVTLVTRLNNRRKHIIVYTPLIQQMLPSCYTQVTIKARGPRDVILLVIPF